MGYIFLFTPAQYIPVFIILFYSILLCTVYSNVGTYIFKMAINPEYKVGEITFENNAALCSLYYSQMTAVINNCTLTRP